MSKILSLVLFGSICLMPSQLVAATQSNGAAAKNGKTTNGMPTNGKATNGMYTNGKAKKGDTLHWYTNYNQAVAEAKKENRPLLLFFTGSDWCGWCKKMDQEIFDSPDFVKAAGSEFVFVEVDFPMNQKLPEDEAMQNGMLKRKYGITGYPTVIILDPAENFVAETGYRSGGGKAYAEYLKKLIGSKS